MAALTNRNYKFFSVLVATIASLLGGCGSSKDEVVEVPAASAGADGLYHLEDSVYSVDGSTISLKNDNNKITVMLLGDIRCLPCQEEARNFVAALTNKTSAPSKVNVYSMMVGNSRTEAANFKAEYSIPWTMLYDEYSTFSNKYCPTNVRPCIIVNDPAKGIILRKSDTEAVIKFADLIKITGAWE